MKYVVYLGITIYGLFYHISSSEFWPITISKAWLNFDNFEYSLLQKPLFGLFLSLFHFFPIDDITHIYVVKLIFALMGTFGIVIYVKLIIEISGFKVPTKFKNIFECILLLVLLALSPVLLHNFFRIRTDQVTFLLFSLAVLFNYRKQLLKSMFFLTLIPLVSIKGCVFIIPAFFIFFPNLKKFFFQIRSLHKYYLIASVLGLFIWLINLNFPAISYLFETYKSMEFPNPSLKQYLVSEFILIFISLAVSVYLLYKKDTLLKSYAQSALSLFFLITLLPQSYPFYIASLAPFLYLPMFIVLIKSLIINSTKKIVFIFIQASFALGITFYSADFYTSMNKQIDYIKKVSQLIETNNLTYLDGMGILPRQKFIRCFVSPNDDIANGFCLNNVNLGTPDAIIVTQRLAYFGPALFELIKKNYTQVLPNLWIKTSFTSLVSKENIDLWSIAPAIYIFGFE